jgi:hypothetical protein
MPEIGVAVIQQGARRNYMYARRLADPGLLLSLITDVAWVQGRRGDRSQAG